MVTTGTDGFGGGGFGALLIGALLPRLLDDHRNDSGGAARAVDTDVLLQGQGQLRYEIPTQTNAILAEQFNGRMEAAELNTQSTIANLQGFAALGKETALVGKDAELAAYRTEMGLSHQIAQSDSQTRAEIARLGFDNAILGQQNKYETALQLAAMSAQNAQCCCEIKLETERGFGVTNLNLERQGAETRYRDLQNHCDTTRLIEEVKCLIKDTSKDQRIAALENENFRSSQRFQTGEIVAAVGNGFTRQGSAINQLGSNQLTTAPATSVWPPYNPGFYY
jgi:hypothetical protein